MLIECFTQYCIKINSFFALPATIIFLSTAVFFTIKTGFLQIFGISKFLSLIFNDPKKLKDGNIKTINPFHALFTAMAATIGIGNIVGPTMAIATGGPGGLFWLLLYNILGSATKFVEVTFSLYTRKKMENGDILGGPTEYLKLVHPLLAKWYGLVTILLFAGWSGLQSNTLAKILEQENISTWITGLILITILMLILFGGAKRVGAWASKLVPLMFILYVLLSFFIIFKDITAFKNALILIFNNIFTPAAAIGGFLGATIFQAIRWGTYRGIYITESGTGTSGFAHALADTKNPTDQGILAMFGSFAETFLCLISGLSILVTGVWTTMETNCWNNTLIYQAFKLNVPLFGKHILILIIGLFAFTTSLGDCFNGGQSLASFTKHRGINYYYIFALCVTFLGAISDVRLIWEIMDIFLALVAIPNLIGLVILAFKYPHVLKIKKN